MATKAPAFNLREAYENKLSESRIDTKSAKALGYKMLTAAQAPEGIPYDEPGILIPYFDINGKQTKFWRYRYLKEPERRGFAALTKNKPLRYVQPGKTVNELYLPPILRWKEIADDVA